MIISKVVHKKENGIIMKHNSQSEKKNCGLDKNQETKTVYWIWLGIIKQMRKKNCLYKELNIIFYQKRLMLIKK